MERVLEKIAGGLCFKLKLNTIQIHKTIFNAQRRDDYVKLIIVASVI